MREKWIDNAKGLAILLVILGHVTSNLTGDISFYFVNGIHLTMFFILSGYTLKKKDVTAKTIQQKFNRLMTPYFVACFMLMLFNILNNLIEKGFFSIKNVTAILSRDLSRTFFASGYLKEFAGQKLDIKIGSIWFLPAMFFAILISQYIISKLDDIKSGMLLGAISMLGYLSARFIWLPFSLQAAMMATVFIWMGYMLRKTDILSKIKWYHYIIAQIVFLFGIYHKYCGIGFVYAYSSDMILSVFVGFAGCMLMYLIAKADTKGKLLEFCGRNSLLILCTHFFTLEICKPYVNKALDMMKLSGNNRVWVYTAIEFALSLGLAGIIILFGKLKKDNSRRSLDDNVKLSIVKLILIIGIISAQFGIDKKFMVIVNSCCYTSLILLFAYKHGEKNYKKRIIDCIVGCVVPFIIFFICFMRIGNKYSGLAHFTLWITGIIIIHTAIELVIKNDIKRFLTILMISVVGITFIKEKIYLPGKAEMILYLTIYYEIGYLINKYNILDILRNNYICYFALAPMWVYLIYKDGISILNENYGNQYGIGVLGSIAGLLVIYQLVCMMWEKIR